MSLPTDLNHAVTSIVGNKEFSFKQGAVISSVGGSEPVRNFALAIAQELTPIAKPSLFAAAGALAGAAANNPELGAVGALALGVTGMLSGKAPRTR